MRNRLSVPRRALALAFGLLATAATARGDITLYETVDVVPRSVVALPRSYYVPTSYVSESSVVVPTSYASVYDLTPTSYYVPTSYVVPTSYYVPTRYASTSYYVPTSFYETSYVYRRRPFGRRYVETSYLAAPTVALTPTYYVAPRSYVATSAVVGTSLCCGETAPAVMPSAPVRAARPLAEPMPERQAGGSIESSAVGETEDRLEPITPPNPSRQRPAGTNGNASGAAGNAGSSTSGVAGTGTPAAASPTIPGPTPRDTRPTPAGPGTTGGTPTTTGGPAPVESTPKAATNPVTKPAEAASPPQRTEFEPPPVPAPVGPGNPLDFPGPNTDDATRRSSYKPVVPTIGTRLAQNVLRGRVVSADTRLPESGVEVILVERRNRFDDRTTRTDASGRFALVVPEGDWTIHLTMPSGRALPVEQGLVTASAGKVSDRWGRELTNLVLSR